MVTILLNIESHFEQTYKQFTKQTNNLKMNTQAYNSYLRFDESWIGSTLDRYDKDWVKRKNQEMHAVVEAAISDMSFIRRRNRDVAVPLQLFRVWQYLYDDERHELMRYLVVNRSITPAPMMSKAHDALDMATDRKNQAESPVVQKPRPLKKPKKVYQKPFYNHGPYRDIDEPYEEEWIIVRNPNLLERLHVRLGKFWSRPVECVEMTPVEPEMEDARGEEEGAVKASNVVLGETQQESVGGTLKRPPDYYINLSSSEGKPSYSNLTDRFNYVKTVAWNKTQLRDATLLKLDFPRAALAISQDPCMAPPYMPFTIHRYARMGMQFKIQINSNKFQVGQLQCSWQYLEPYTKNPLDTVYERAQLPHCLVNAGAGNEATLNVPFSYHKPYMHTKLREGFTKPLCLGTLTIKVLSPLSIADGGPSEASLSLFIRFLDASFTGMIDANIDKPAWTQVSPEMEAVVEELGMMAMRSAIDYAFGDKNCDNPPGLEPPKYFVPATGQTWSIGNGESHPTNMLRLSAVKGCGRSGDPEENELDMAYPCSVWGMLKPFKWNSKASGENSTGALLWSTAVHPMCEKNKMYSHKQNLTGALTTYVMPPVGVISSMFQYWRGSLEYRFDIVASQFHSGRLLVAYVPGVADPSKITISQARNSAHMVFSLQEATSFTFVVPYIADKPWWNRRYAGPQRKIESVAPSGIVMFVLNPLVVMDKVVPTVEVIPYVRAGKDFELAVPVQPAIGISDVVINYLTESEKLRPLPDYSPFYVGQCSVGADLNLFRYGVIAQHYAQFSSIKNMAPLDQDQVYVWTVDKAPGCPKVQVKGQTGKNAVMYCVPLQIDGYTYAMAFTDANKAVQAAYSWLRFKDPAKLVQYDTAWVENDAEYGEKDLVYYPKIYSVSTSKPSESFVELLADAVRVEPEMEERRAADNLLQPTSTLPATNAGKMNFGEQFFSLKDLLRRYQLYWEGVVKPIDDGVTSRALLRFPVSPSGLELDVQNPNQIWNILRDGALGIVSSGYRYFRGGMRFRIVFPVGLDCNAWVQHHPDKPADNGLYAVPGVQIHVADAFRNHQYGFYIQSLKVNNVISISVPFYQPGVYGILRKLSASGSQTDLRDYVTLGDLVVGLEGTVPPSVSIPISVYASLEDDMSFNVFQGFPPVVFCEDTVEALSPKQTTLVEPEMMSAAKCLGVAAVMSAASYVGVRSALKGATSMAATTAKVCVDDAFQKYVRPIVDEVKADVGVAAEKLSDDVEDAATKTAIVTGLGNLMHVFANPKPRTIAIALVNCIVTATYAGWNMISKFYDVMHVFIEKYWAKFRGADSDEVEVSVVEPEALGDQLYDESAATSMLFTFACALVGVTASLVKPGSYFNLMRNISVTAQLPTNIMRFLSNCGETLKYFVKWLCMKDDASIRASVVLDESLPDVKLWFAEAQYLLDPRNRSRLECDRLLNNRVYDACTVGSLLVANGLSDHLPGGKVLWDTYKELCKVRTRLVDAGKHPDVRFEAFSIWINGTAGLGKSSMTADIAASLLDKIQYKTNGASCYYLCPGAKYWNGYVDQPIIVRDDAYQITSGPSFEEELASHFAICSSSVLNPPKAAVEDKNLRANPLVYLMLANQAFPIVQNHVADAAAIYRRRKFMVEAECKPEILERWRAANPGLAFTDASQLPSEETQNFNHLRFRTFLSPTTATMETPKSEWYSYAEMKTRMVDAFLVHYQQEQVRFRQRVNDMYSRCPVTGENVYTDLPALGEQVSLHDQMEIIRARAEEVLAQAEDPELERLSYWQHLKAGFVSCIRRYVPEGPLPRTQTVDPEGRGYVDPERADNCWLSILRVLGLPEEANALMSSLRWEDPSEMVMFALDPSRELSCATFNCRIRNNDHQVLFPLFLPKEQFTKIQFGSTEYNVNAYRSFKKFLEEGVMPERYQSWTQPGLEVDEQLRRYLMCVLAYAGSFSMFDTLCFWTNLKRRVVDGQCDIYSLAHDIMQWEVHDQDKHNGICSCARFWGSVLGDKAETVTYSRSRDRFYYRDCIGLSMECPKMCPHPGSIVRTAAFRRLICLWYDKVLERRGEVGQRESTSPEYQGRCEDALVALTQWERMKLKMKHWYEQCLSPAVAKFMRFLIHFMPIILTTVIGAVASWGVSYALNKLTSGNSFDANMSFEGTGNYYKWDAPKANAKHEASHSVPSFQSSPAARVQMIRKLTNNTIFIEATWSSAVRGRSHQGCRCFVPFGHRVIMLRHYLEEFAAAREEAEAGTFKLRVIFNVSSKQSSLWLDPDDLFSSVSKPNVDSNFVLVTLPKAFPLFKTVLHLFATKAHHSNLGSTCDLYPVTETASYDLLVDVKKNYLVAGEAHVSDVKMGRVYTYMRHGRGLCGSLLVCPSVNGGNGGIVGMHVAGSSGTGEGVAEPLYREMFDSAFASRGYDESSVMTMNLEPVPEQKIEKLDSNMMLYGSVPKQYAHHESGKTKIVPSLIQGAVYKVRTEPNPLQPNDPRQPPGSHPLYDGCRKHGSGNVRGFDTSTLRVVVEAEKTCQRLTTTPVRAEIKPFTLQQAICGDVDVPYCDALNWKSSEGFPLRTLRPAGAFDKRWLFDLEESKDGFKLKGMKEPLLQQLAIRDECFRKNVKPHTVYEDCTKDYRLTPEKCAIPGKTRIFSIAPVQCTIDSKRYLGDLCCAIKNSRIKNGVAIGINPDSFEWSQLVYYLHEVGTNIITLDYTNYGPTLMSQLVEGTVEIFTCWLDANGADKEHIDRAEWILRNDILNPVHLCEDVIYQTLNGIASGSPITGEMNSIPNKLYMRLAWLDVMKDEPKMNTMSAFDENVRIVAYGDDNIMSVSDAAIGKYNAVTIAASLREHGITLTNATKKKEIVTHGTILEATFLKRGFAPHPTRSGVWLAPLDTASIEECVNWIHACNDPRDATLQACQASLDLAYGMGPAWYDQHRLKLQNAAKRIGCVLRSKTWRERDAEIFGDSAVGKVDLSPKYDWIINNDYYQNC